jgi:alpha-L-fucosidase
VPTKAFLDQWEGKIIEVIDKYNPDFIWFDFGLELIPDSYKQDMLAYYFNSALALKKDVVVSYKDNHLLPGAGLRDLELGQEADLTYYEWITDTSIDDGGGWGYVNGLGFKTVDNLVDNLADRVSKNRYLLLNVGPKPDGTIPEEAKERLLVLGIALSSTSQTQATSVSFCMANVPPMLFPRLFTPMVATRILSLAPTMFL